MPLTDNAEMIHSSPTVYSGSGDKPKILFVSEAPIDSRIPNGVQTSVKRLLDHLQEESYDVRVICPRTDRVPDQYAGYKITTVRSATVQGFPAGIGGANKIPRIIKKYNPDILYCASPFSPMSEFAINAASEAGIAIIPNYQTDIPGYADDQGKSIIDRYEGNLRHDGRGEYSPADKLIRRLAHHSLQAVGLGHRPKKIAARRVAMLHNQGTINLAPSASAKQDMIEYGVDEASIRIWGRGVDTVTYNPDRRNSPLVQELREHLLNGREVPIGGYVGRIAPEKGLESLSKLAELDFQLVLVGDGPSMPEIKKKLGDRAIFLGNMNGEELANTYAAFDFFVHTGKKETFGQTIQEAKATGIPPIAPAIGGPLDTIEHGRTGLLYDPDDDKDLRLQVELLINDPPLRRRMGALARKSVENRSWHSLGVQYEGYLQEALSLQDKKQFSMSHY